MNTSMVKGSVLDLASNSKQTVVEALQGALINGAVLVLVDSSASMGDCDTKYGSRHDAADHELATLQAANPGKIIVVSWSNTAEFCLDGRVKRLDGGTMLTVAFDLLDDAGTDGLADVIVVTDGDVSDERESIDYARRAKSRISAVYVGPEGGAGEAFTRRLARAGRGTSATSAKVGELAAPIAKMLELKAGSV